MKHHQNDFVPNEKNIKGHETERRKIEIEIGNG